MGGQWEEVKVTNVKFMDKKTGAIILEIKEAEVCEDWVPYKEFDEGVGLIDSSSCAENQRLPLLNGGWGK